MPRGADILDILTQSLGRGRTRVKDDGSMNFPPHVTEEQRATVTKFMSVLEDSKRGKEVQTTTWEQCFRYYMNDQNEELPEWKADITENYIHSTVETALSLMNSNRPVPEFHSEDPIDSKYAWAMQELFQRDWEHDDGDETASEVDKCALLFGNGFWHPYFDHFTKRTCFEAVAPHEMFVHPKAKRLQKSEYVIRVSKKSRSRVLYEYPEAADKLDGTPTAMKIDDEYLAETQPGSVESDYPHGFRLNTDMSSSSTVVPYGRISHIGSESLCDVDLQVFEGWFRDYRMERTVTENPNNPMELVIQDVPVYPNGRKIVICNNCVLYDGPSDEPHGEWPFVEQICYKITGRFWKKGMVQDLLPIQDEYNKTLQQLIDNRNHTGNQQTKHVPDGIYNPDMHTSEPGLRIPMAQINNVMPMETSPMPGYVVDLLHFLRTSFERVSNVASTMQGRASGGAVSGVAINSLYEYANTAMAFLIMNKEQAVVNVGKQWLAHAQANYEELKMVPVTNPETGEVEHVQLPPDIIRKGWKVKIVPGSSVPMNWDNLYKWGIELLKVGAFDQQALLESVRHPQARKVLERVQAEQKRQMELEIQKAQIQSGLQQGQGQGPPMGPGAEMPQIQPGMPQPPQGLM